MLYTGKNIASIFPEKPAPHYIYRLTDGYTYIHTYTHIHDMETKSYIYLYIHRHKDKQRHSLENLLCSYTEEYIYRHVDL